MRKLLAATIALVVLGGFILPALADDHTVITMDLDDEASINVDPATWDISGGTGTTSSTTFWLNNTGTIAVSVDISTNSSTDGGAWSRGNDTGHDTYYVRENYTGAAWTNVTSGGYTFDSDLSPSGETGDSDEFTVEVGLPISSSTSTQQTTRLTFTATVN